MAYKSFEELEVWKLGCRLAGPPFFNIAKYFTKWYRVNKDDF